MKEKLERLKATRKFKEATDAQKVYAMMEIMPLRDLMKAGELLSTKQVAAQFGYNKWSICRLVRMSKIKAVTLPGGQFVFFPEQIAESFNA